MFGRRLLHFKCERYEDRPGKSHESHDQARETDSSTSLSRFRFVDLRFHQGHVRSLSTAGLRGEILAQGADLVNAVSFGKSETGASSPGAVPAFVMAITKAGTFDRHG